MFLTELQLDALKEVINTGVGYAAGSLNDLVDSPISLHVPNIEIMVLEEECLRKHLFGNGRVASVHLGFSGPLCGSGVLIFPYDSALRLVSLLTGDEGSNSDVDGIRAATLEETGNIILNGVVGSVSNLLQGQIAFSIPYYSEQGGLPSQFAGLNASSVVEVIFARARFGVAQHEIEGEISLFFEMGSLQTLVSALERLLETLA
jgi:chemotaxis protein CheC